MIEGCRPPFAPPHGYGSPGFRVAAPSLPPMGMGAGGGLEDLRGGLEDLRGVLEDLCRDLRNTSKFE